MTHTTKIRAGVRPGRIAAAALLSALIMPGGPAVESAQAAMMKQVIEHYDVWGKDVDELKTAIRLAGPLDGRAFGLTHVTIEPQFDYVTAGGECRTSGVSVDVEVRVTLPQWIATKPIPASLGGRWSTLEATVHDHEMTHVEIAQSFADHIEAVITRASSTAGCAALKDELTAKVKQLQAAHRFAQIQFDMDEKERLRALLP